MVCRMLSEDECGEGRARVADDVDERTYGTTRGHHDGSLEAVERSEGR